MPHDNPRDAVGSRGIPRYTAGSRGESPRNAVGSREIPRGAVGSRGMPMNIAKLELIHDVCVYKLL